MLIDEHTIWYVIARKGKPGIEDNYPVLIYADKNLAQEVARVNNELLIPVKPILNKE